MKEPLFSEILAMVLARTTQMKSPGHASHYGGNIKQPATPTQLKELPWGIQLE